MSKAVRPDILDILMTAVHLAATELAQVHPQSESSEESIVIWQKYLLQQAIKKQDGMTEAERFLYRLTHLILPQAKTAPEKFKIIPCDTCQGTGECQGIPIRQNCGDGCECVTIDNCPLLGECAVCGGEGALEVPCT